ncbi:MAG TPA: hypothetical protein VFI13_13485 [Gemmatimonadales bacterium]|nr:hypothetical protein [Gemmatimonadales bacterium]
MSTATTLVLKTFVDRAEALAHALLRAGEAPRLLAYDEFVGCPMDMALTALEWTSAVGVLQDDDLVHAARLTSETASCVIERRTAGGGRQFVHLGPRMDAPIIDVFEGKVLYDEPGVRAVEFAQRAHALAHFLRATGGAGAILSILSRRAPEVRHLKRWLRPALEALDQPRPMLVGWFSAGGGGTLFHPVQGENEFRYIEAGIEP